VTNGSCNGCSVACNAGYGDCNANAGDGCETNTASNANHCGACGKSCAANEDCVGGVCMGPETYGPMHTFGGMTSDHFVTQGCCSVGCNGNNDVDAAYFCARFYGANCAPKPGYYIAQTPNLTYPKMHKYQGCSPYGVAIPGTTCDGGACRITDLAEITIGLVNLVCECD
ncbi:MAG: hypothetical protein KC486_12170, partial [Myxococcales bacterium]|nr:hypothetical protein [Myxococcales bacterium]